VIDTTRYGGEPLARRRRIEIVFGILDGYICVFACHRLIQLRENDGRVHENAGNLRRGIGSFRRLTPAARGQINAASNGFQKGCDGDDDEARRRRAYCERCPTERARAENGITVEHLLSVIYDCVYCSTCAVVVRVLYWAARCSFRILPRDDGPGKFKNARYCIYFYNLLQSPGQSLPHVSLSLSLSVCGQICSESVYMRRDYFFFSSGKKRNSGSLAIPVFFLFPLSRSSYMYISVWFTAGRPQMVFVDVCLCVYMCVLTTGKRCTFHGTLTVSSGPPYYGRDVTTNRIREREREWE